MARFAFRLERLLALRRRREDDARRAFAEARRATQAEEGLLAALRAEVEASRVDVRGAVDPGRMSLFAGLRDALEARVRRSTARLAVLAGAEEEARRGVEAATRAVRALERLRERRAAGHRVEEARREQSVLDEAGARSEGRP